MIGGAAISYGHPRPGAKSWLVYSDLLGTWSNYFGVPSGVSACFNTGGHERCQ